MKHFMDIGSNCGQTFDWLATQPHDYSDHIFWAFEASPRHFSALSEKCKAMSGKYEIKLCAFGLGGRYGNAIFFQKDDPLGDSFEAWIHTDHPQENIRTGYLLSVAKVPLADFILENTKEGDEIVLDIDAEGSEYEMLHNLLASPEACRRVKRIMVEFHYVGAVPIVYRKAKLIQGFEAHGLTLEVRGCVP